MRQTLTAMLLLACALHMSAQRIDFDLPNKNNCTESGFTPWAFGAAQSQTLELDGGISVTVSCNENYGGRIVKTNWNKDLVNANKLTGDGVTIYGLDDDNNTPQVRGEAVRMDVTVKGLSAGTHSLMAYHNNTDRFTACPIDVYVGDTKVLTGVEQTTSEAASSASGQSYVTFSVAAGETVTISYVSVPDAAVDYSQGNQCTTVTINGLIFDEPNPKTTALDPTPANEDEHADADGGQCTLRWTAASVAVKHHLYWGTAADELTEVAVLTDASYDVKDLSPMNHYYWRVDEEDADGNVYRGNVWSFQPRRLAFPGAEGYGRYAIGGRGGTVYHVTSLDDDDKDPQPGTFRYGITQAKGPRTIVFDVAGVIYLKNRISCADKYVTVAGQTAPGAGIMFRGATFGMQSDGITRFVRSRRGHLQGTTAAERDADAGKGSDGLGMTGNDFAIMDHCSISWTIDEAFSSRGAKGMTLQRTLISEALNDADHPNYTSGTRHGYAATIGGGEMGGLPGSYHHNLLAHNEGRNWSLSGGLDGKGDYDGHHDVFNNVVYNWGGRATDGGTHELNFVNNYYKKGPATRQNLLLRHQFEGTGSGTQRAYVSGNIREELNGQLTQDQEGVTYRYEVSGSQKLDWEPWAAEPFFPSYATVETAEAAYKNVLSDVGCTQPALDLHDQRMIAETLAGTYSAVGSKTKEKGLIDSEEDEGCEGYDLQKLGLTVTSRPAGFDTDADGIPDWFEDLMGWDKSTANNNDVHHAEAYTDLEQYLNWLAEPHFILQKGAAATSVALGAYFAGYTAPRLELQAEQVMATQEQATTEGRLEGDVLQVSGLGKGLFSYAVKATDPDTGITLTRQFHFAVVDALPALETASVRTVTAEQPAADMHYYDLQGRRVQQPSRGIYIQNGKKIVIR